MGLEILTAILHRIEGNAWFEIAKDGSWIIVTRHDKGGGGIVFHGSTFEELPALLNSLK